MVLRHLSAGSLGDNSGFRTAAIGFSVHNRDYPCFHKIVIEYAHAPCMEKHILFPLHLKLTSGPMYSSLQSTTRRLF